MTTVAYPKVALINQDGQVLVLWRAKADDQRPGEADFPGGGLEEGEDFVSGLIREIREEAGIDVAFGDPKLFYAATEVKDGVSKTRLLFWARVANPQVRLSAEHDAFEWVRPEDISEKFPHPFYSAGVQYGLMHGIFSTSA